MKNNQAVSAEKIPFYQVDAFADRPFSGNPAAVCLLDSWLDDITLQNIARENNLSETAFVVRQDEDFALRWFTPAVEVDLCGHATLAAAAVLFSLHDFAEQEIRFSTRSGILKVKSDGDNYTLDFPLVNPLPISAPEGLLAALGLEGEAAEIWQASDIVVIIKDEERLEMLSPDYAALEKFATRGVVVTVAAQHYDFRSRWFGPQVGVNEDPVTGSAHTFLAPLWADKLGKKHLCAQQGGPRKGNIDCHIKDNGRVELTGKARLMVEGYFLL